jgi:hypothetical protein
LILAQPALPCGGTGSLPSVIYTEIEFSLGLVMVVSAIIGAVASTAAGGYAKAAAGASTAGLAGASLAGKTVPHFGLIAASQQAHLAPQIMSPVIPPSYIWPAGPIHVNTVSYMYNHMLYLNTWVWPFPFPK